MRGIPSEKSSCLGRERIESICLPSLEDLVVASKGGGDGQGKSQIRLEMSIPVSIEMHGEVSLQ